MSDLNSAPIALGILPQTAQPQANRLRWEQQWLRENRNAFDVITDARADAGNTEEQLPLFDSAELPSQTPAQKTADAVNAVGARDTVATQSTAAELFAPIAPVALPATINGSGWLNTSLQLQLDAAANTASAPEHNALSGNERGAAKSFALWLADDQVTVALRLRPQQRERDVIASLRQWLRESGLTLRALIVNGITRWRREPPHSDGF